MYECERVRQLVAEMFRQFGATSPESLLETVMIRDGYYCGRRFECDGFSAVWFVEENQIKLIDRQGALLQVISIEKVESEIDRKAA